MPCSPPVEDLAAEAGDLAEEHLRPLTDRFARLLHSIGDPSLASPLQDKLEIDWTYPSDTPCDLEAEVEGLNKLLDDPGTDP